MLVTRQIPALFNGVSQQPAPLRLLTQCEAQVNAVGTVADGLRKRPPFQHVARITEDDISSGFIHTINRDVTERYVVVITAGKIQVFDAITGQEKTVNTPGRSVWRPATGYLKGEIIVPTNPNGWVFQVIQAGTTGTTEPQWNTEHHGDTTDSGTVRVKAVQDYLYANSPSTSFAVVTVADYSFVVNKTVQVRTKTSETTQPFNYDYQYDPLLWAYSGLDPSQYFWTPSGAHILKDTVQTFSDLPGPDAKPPEVPPAEGDVFKVAGYDQDNFGAYYVKYTGGVYVETYGPGANTGLDEYTMPHALVREADGTFTFTTFKWKVRQVGDDDTNPHPTFVNRTINDVFYWKNRLGFVSDENVVFSAVNDFGNFYRTTVVDLLDSDPVDVAVSSQKVSVLKFAVPFANGLMLFADQTQFSVNVDQLLTPTSVSIDTATNYEMKGDVRPVGIGSDVYFVTETGQHSHVREYFVRAESVQTDATNITAHVPRFLPRGITRLAGSPNANTLVAISEEPSEDHRVYVYQFFWSGDDKVQSAWSYWELDDNDRILSVDMIDMELFALIKRADGTYLEKADFSSGAVYGDLPFDILVDRRAALGGGTYVPGGDYTEYALDYPLSTQQEKDKLRVIRTDSPGTHAGKLMDQVTIVDNQTIRLPGDTTSQTFVYGLQYVMTYQFSEQFMPSREDQGSTIGRLMLRTFNLSFTDAAYFKTEVDPYGSGHSQVEEVVPAQLSEFTGKTVGSSALVTGRPIFESGVYSFQVHGDARTAVIKLVNDSHVQSKFNQVDWEGFFFARARPV